jgi:hypothetical protein
LKSVTKSASVSHSFAVEPHRHAFRGERERPAKGSYLYRIRNEPSRLNRFSFSIAQSRIAPSIPASTGETPPRRAPGRGAPRPGRPHHHRERRVPRLSSSTVNRGTASPPGWAPGVPPPVVRRRTRGRPPVAGPRARRLLPPPALRSPGPRRARPLRRATRGPSAASLPRLRWSPLGPPCPRTFTGAPGAPGAPPPTRTPRPASGRAVAAGASRGIGTGTAAN